ncbi:MAG TPA: ABC transporter ATP-binding protein, partial [Acidimicrobiales bacterium]|nr:ABC transporter ATP-binding protein [Acidimicrobiales bacterium]
RLHGRLCGLAPDQQRAEGRRVLRLVGLGDRGRDRVSGFSKGMQQRLGLGVALIGRPDLLLLDEPTSALDPRGRADVRRLIDDLRAAGTTILLNSHLLSEVERSCDRVVVLNRGRVVADGTLDAWLGGDAVRIRLEQPAGEYAQAPAGWGAVTADGHDLTVAGVPAHHVADVVAAVVAAGGRVTSVDAGHTSLEERLLALLSHDQLSPDGLPPDQLPADALSDHQEPRP